MGQGIVSGGLGTLLVHLAMTRMRSRRCLVLCRNTRSARFLDVPHRSAGVYCVSTYHALE